jgi:exonuclease SbcC
VGEVNSRLQTLLGLEYEAFIQSVLLPQGEFSRFLKSKPADQRQILRDLLRLGVYERMRERAFAQAKENASLIENDRKLLEGPYADATQQNVSWLEVELETLTARKQSLTEERESLKALLDTLRAQWRLVEERQHRRRTLEQLEQDRARIDELRRGVELGKRAAQVLPVLEQAAAKLKAWRACEKEAGDLQQELEGAQKIAQDKAYELSEAQKQADTLPARRSREGELLGIRPVLKEKALQEASRQRARTELSKMETAIVAGKVALEDAEGAVVRSRALMEKLGKERTALAYDAAIHEIFKKARIPAHDLGEARKQAEALDPKAVQTAFDLAANVLREAEKESAATSAEQADAQETFKTARVAYEAAQDQHKAAALRLGLTPGCACPVCEQPVHRVPPGAPPADLEKARKALEAASQAYDKATKQASKASSNVSRAQADADNAGKSVADWKLQAERVRNRVEDFSTQLTAAIAPFNCPEGMLGERFVEKEWERLERVHSQWEGLSKQIVEAEVEIHKADSSRKTAAVQLAADEKTKARLTEDIAEAEKRLREYDAQIQSVGSEDPEKELKVLQKEIADIDRHLGLALKEHQSADNLVHQLEVKATAARGRLEAALADRDQFAAMSASALREAGFSDSIEANNSAMELRKIAEGEQQVAGFEQNVSQTQGRIQELEFALKGVALTEADVRREAEKTAAAEKAVVDLADQISQKTNALQRLKADTEKAEALRLSYEGHRARHLLVQQLSQDLKGDAFQQYLLDGSFRRLVAGASTRLRELNERYELAFTDSKFSVIDHDHGSQSRLADTLSGGETFLVSLALALELSEQVQQAAGAVRLDSLFIDEGFGTLDPETLDTVADAIESLSKTNRMVGVITHVAELHRRLPRLEVRPTPSGSVVQYIED